MKTKKMKSKTVLGPLKKEEKHSFLQEHWIFILILLLACIIRLIQFPGIPPGFNQDEASTAYDAYSLWKDGTDRHGYSFPVVLISWNSGMNALPAYLEVPFIAMLGLHEFSARMAFVVMGILSVWLLYLVGIRIEGRVTGLIAAFLLSISPWHILLSRVSIDENALPFFFLTATYFLVRVREKSLFIFPAFIFLGLALGTHQASYFAVPVFAVFSTGILVWNRAVSLKTLIHAWVLLVALALPHMIYLAINWWNLPEIATPFLSIPHSRSATRFEMVSSIFSDHPIQGTIQNFEAFWEYMKTQNDKLPWNGVPGYGFLYAGALPLCLLGLLSSFGFEKKSRQIHARWFIIAWLITAVLMTGLMAVNTNRINLLFIPLIFFAAVGISLLYRYKAVFLLIISTYIIFFGVFTYNFLETYPAYAGSSGFYVGINEAIRYAVQAKPTGTICVTENANQSYIFVLFSAQTEPQKFWKTVQYADKGAAFHSVISFDRYLFGLHRCEGHAIAAYVLHESEVPTFEHTMFSITHFEHYAVALPQETQQKM